ncbi:MAG: hypothetical protein KBD31_00810 [Proteobacteria bacterium]|nr:hypothetical protein [Pseudomonadota bacterium]
MQYIKKNTIGRHVIDRSVSLYGKYICFKKVKNAAKYGMASFLLTGLYATEQEAGTQQSVAQRQVVSAIGEYRSFVNIDTQNKLQLKGREILNQILSGQRVDNNIYNFVKEIDDKKYLYAPLMVYADLGLWARSAYKLFHTEDKTVIEQKNYLASIICIAWALNQMAQDKNQPFARGSYTIVDPDHRIYEYLKGYVALCTKTTEPEKLAYAATSNNFAYRRDPTLGGSSHHKEHSPESQFGIDARFSSDEGVLKVLPFGHSHLLFGKLVYGNNHLPLTFIKFEEVGLGNVACAIAHATNFGSSGNAGTKTRREKDIPQFAKDIYHSIMGDDKPLPKSVREMYFSIQEKDNILASTFERELAELGYDFVYIRKGNEVILDFDKITS